MLRVSRAVILGAGLRDVLDQITATAISLDGVEGSRIWFWHTSSRQLELVAETLPADWVRTFDLAVRYDVTDVPDVIKVITSSQASSN